MPVNILLLLLLGLMWGSAYGGVKLALEAFPAIWTVALRLALATAILLPLAYMSGERMIRRLDVWLWCGLLAIVGMVAPFFVISWGQIYVDSALTAIFVAATPLFTLLLAHAFTGDEKITPRRVIGFVSGFTGICVLIGPRTFMEMQFEGFALIAELAILFGAVLYAVNMLFARWSPDAPLLMKSAILTGVAAMMTLPLAFALAPITHAPITASSLWGLAIVAIFPTALATPLWFALVARAGASFTSLGNYLSPLFAVFIGIFLLGEHLHVHAFIALGLILIAVALCEPVGRLVKLSSSQNNPDTRPQ